MSNRNDAQVEQAAQLAAQAAEIASQLKPGSWESVQALALSSIAISLAQLAGRPRGFPSAD